MVEAAGKRVRCHAGYRAPAVRRVEAAGLWTALHVAVLQRLQAIGELDWSRTVIDSIQVRAEKGAT